MNHPSHPSGSGGEPAGKPDHPLWKKILFTILIVGFLFGSLETVLWVGGVEPVLVEEDPFVGFAGNVPLFVESKEPSGEEFLVTAPNKRLFNPQRFPAAKKEGAYRIFCLGGSTTFGRPFDDNSSFAGWLRELLAGAAPEVDWQVINAGGVSYASYRVAHLMKELVRYEPDMFIIYTGQNEFLEERTYRNLRSTPAFVRAVSGILARTRTWALVGSALGGLGSTAKVTGSDKTEMAEEADTLLEHFGPEAYQRDDELAARIREHFLVSLDRMARLAGSRGAGVVMVKPASNLKDCSPFRSQHSDDLSPEALARCEEIAASAAAALADREWNRALPLLDQALAIDPRFADYHYRRGKALVHLGRSGEARTAFLRALEEDVCPLRIPPLMAEGLARVAADRELPLVDFDGLISATALAETGAAIAGNEFFLDHVHPTIGANGLLAVELARTVLAETGRSGALLTAAVFEQAEARIEARLDPPKRARSLANLAAVLAWAGKIEDAVGPAHQSLDLGVDDSLTILTAAGILATWYATTGDSVQEKLYYRMALNAGPDNHDTHWRIGLRALERDPPEVELACAHLLRAAVYWQGERRDAPHRVLGGILASRGLPQAGFSHLLEAQAIDPRNPDTMKLLDDIGGRLGPSARTVATPKFTVEKYPSGAIRTIVQVKIAGGGQAVPDGVWTEWHEGGEPRLLREMSDGAVRGVEVQWNRGGVEISRVPPGVPGR